MVEDSEEAGMDGPKFHVGRETGVENWGLPLRIGRDSSQDPYMARHEECPNDWVRNFEEGA